MMDSHPDWRAYYTGRGWETVPTPAGLKHPVVEGWNTRSFGPEDFAAGDNITIVLGARSGWLADIDLDCPEAITLADLYLPQTGAEFGGIAGLDRMYVTVASNY